MVGKNAGELNAHRVAEDFVIVDADDVDFIWDRDACRFAVIVETWCGTVADGEDAERTRQAIEQEMKGLE